MISVKNLKSYVSIRCNNINENMISYEAYNIGEIMNLKAIVLIQSHTITNGYKLQTILSSLQCYQYVHEAI